ncbi:hypothetical protein CB1_001951004 [Camelus ferus]|nr:hypothetical protein CB1_001951004 [Camelus ferus]
MKAPRNPVRSGEDPAPEVVPDTSRRQKGDRPEVHPLGVLPGISALRLCGGRASLPEHSLLLEGWAPGLGLEHWLNEALNGTNQDVTCCSACSDFRTPRHPPLSPPPRERHATAAHYTMLQSEPSCLAQAKIKYVLMAAV